MKSGMDLKMHHDCVQRAIELGRTADPAALPELVRLIGMPSAEVRRLAASAIGKLAGFGADAEAAVSVLAPVALRDPHPQARQYALKALKGFGTAAAHLLPELQDMADNSRERDYVRRAAASAMEIIREAVRIAERQTKHVCMRCGMEVAPDEYARSRKMFQRPYCDKCFDETYIERRNFDTRVEVNKTLRAADGTLVQSGGERRIAEWLTTQAIRYRYDDRLRIIEGRQVRPDFYLPELDVYIEYWGMDTLDYRIGMLMKQQLYQHAGKRLISLYPADVPNLDAVLSAKLARLGHADNRAVRTSASGSESGGTTTMEPETKGAPT